MLDCTKLLCGTTHAADALRYRERGTGPADMLRYALDKRPVVVWNLTRRCNLRCVHCYASAQERGESVEVSLEEGLRFLEDLAQFGCPVVLFSGGEPVLHPHLGELVAAAVRLGLRAVLSTNGTLLTAEKARELQQAGIAYVGVSLDGLEATNDRFRGKAGAFREALRGIRHCAEAGIKVGLRFTLTRHNVADLGPTLNLLRTEPVQRLCVYHLVYAGRGHDLVGEDLAHDETRQAVSLIFDKAEEFHQEGLDKEVLTVDNHTDAPFLLQRLWARNDPLAENALTLLRYNGGNNSGIGIAAVDWNGNVHPDQFWQHRSLGSVRERSFGQIWTDLSDPLLAALKDRHEHLKGRCHDCRFLDICNGNFRVRAELVYGDVWAPDPACYLTDREIGVA